MRIFLARVVIVVTVLWFTLLPNLTDAVRGHITGAGYSSPLARKLPIFGTSIAADESTDRIFVLTSVTGAVSVLDAHTGNLLRVVAVGPSPFFVTVDTARGRVFISSDRGESILDARTGALRATWPYHGAIAMSDQTSHIFVCSTTTGFMRPAVVHMLDARTGALLRTVGVGPGGCGLAVAVRTERVFVTSDDGRVRVLDARTGALLRTVAGGSRAIAVAARAGHVFVGDNILDARTGAVVQTAELVGGPIDITVDDRTNRVFVTLQDGESGGDPTFGIIDVLDASSGALIHSDIVHTWPVSVPIVNPRTGHVVVLLRSPQDVRTAQVNGPGSLLVLDGSTGAIRHNIDTGAVMTFGADDVVAEDARAKRLFVLNESGTDMFDAARL